MLIQPITHLNNYQIGSCNMVRIHKNSPASIVKNSGNISFKGVDECVYAAYNGDLGKVRYEVRSNGVNINACHSFDSYCNYGSKTTLWAAVWCHRYDIVDWCMNQDDINPNAGYDDDNPLATAAYIKDKSSFMRILSHPKTNPNLSYTYDKFWGYNNSTLGFVIQNNDKEMFDALLKHPKIKPTMKHITLAKKLNNEDFATRILNHPNTVIDIEELKKDPNMAPAINIGKKLVEKAMEQREEQLKKDKEALEIAQKDLKQREENVSKAESNLQAREKALDKTIKEKTTQIRKEEKEKAEQALAKQKKELDTQKKKLDKEKEEVQKKEETFNSLIEKSQSLIDQGIEDAKDGLRALYNVKTEELPKNMDFEEQKIWVLNVLATRQDKLKDTNKNTPNNITKAIQDNKGNISLDSLNFLERILDAGGKTFSEKDLIESIKSVKGNLGFFDMKKVAMFVSNIAWKDNTTNDVIQMVKNYKVKV